MAKPSSPIKAQQYEFSPQSIEFVLDQMRALLEHQSYLTQGAQAAQFETDFARYLNVPYAVSTNSGTGALEIALRLVDVRGCDVIVTTNTFAATIFAVLRAGGRPIFADILEDFSLDPEEIYRKRTEKTKAVITVHTGGFVSSRIFQLQEFCRQFDLTLVEDAAHAHGSHLAGKYAGAFGDIAAFSFFPTKVITSAEGGMVVTRHTDLAEKARLLRDQAKVGNSNLHEVEGYNWRMSEPHAILGRAQLASIEDFIARRTKVARWYDEIFKDHSLVRTMNPPADSRPNWYKYILAVKHVRPTLLLKELKEKYDVAMGGFVYDIPCHMQPVFAQYRGAPLERAEYLCPRHVCPPIYPALADMPDRVRYIGESILAALEGLASADLQDRDPILAS